MLVGSLRWDLPRQRERLLGQQLPVVVTTRTKPLRKAERTLSYRGSKVPWRRSSQATRVRV